MANVQPGWPVGDLHGPETTQASPRPRLQSALAVQANPVIKKFMNMFKIVRAGRPPRRHRPAWAAQVVIQTA